MVAALVRSQAKRISLPSLGDFTALQDVNRFGDQQLQEVTNSPSTSPELRRKLAPPIAELPLRVDKPTNSPALQVKLTFDDEEKRVSTDNIGIIPQPLPATVPVLSTSVTLNSDAANLIANNAGVAELKLLISQAMQIQQYLMQQRQGDKARAKPKNNELDTDADTNIKKGAKQLPVEIRFDTDAEAKNEAPPTTITTTDTTTALRGPATPPAEKGTTNTSGKGEIEVNWIARTQQELASAVEQREYDRAAQLFSLLQRLTRNKGNARLSASDSPWKYVTVTVKHEKKLGLKLQNTALNVNEEDDDDTGE